MARRPVRPLPQLEAVFCWQKAKEKNMERPLRGNVSQAVLDQRFAEWYASPGYAELMERQAALRAQAATTLAGPALQGAGEATA